MKVCMFVKNSFEYDARVTKEATSLIDAGYDVTVVALHAPGTTSERETTEEGINVVRVSRSHFGGPTLNRIARSYAARVESRHATLTGEPVDMARLIEHGTVAGTSTATPESTRAIDPVDPHSRRASVASARWARITTPILRLVPMAAKWLYGVLRGLLGPIARRAQQRSIDARMIDVGVASGASAFHAHDLNTLRVAALCKGQTDGSVLVYDSHELQTERNRMTERQRRAAIRAERRYLSSADAMIVASPSWIEWNRRLHGSLPDPSLTILNVPPLDRPERSDLFREELGIPENQVIVLYQGSIQENRGIEPAIEAVRLLDDATLVIVGYGHHKPVLEAWVARRSLEHKVRFYGPIPNKDLLRYTASADIGLCNIVNSSVSYHTSLPNKLFEYAMAGIPVIGSDSPEIGRVVQEYGIGEVCDPADAGAIADAVRTISARPGSYSAALRVASETFNWDVEGRKLVNLYTSFPA